MPFHRIFKSFEPAKPCCEHKEEGPTPEQIRIAELEKQLEIDRIDKELAMNALQAEMYGIVRETQEKMSNLVADELYANKKAIEATEKAAVMYSAVKKTLEKKTVEPSTDTPPQCSSASLESVEPESVEPESDPTPSLDSVYSVPSPRKKKINRGEKGGGRGILMKVRGINKPKTWK